METRVSDDQNAPFFHPPTSDSFGHKACGLKARKCKNKKCKDKEQVDDMGISDHREHLFRTGIICQVIVPDK